MNQVLIKPPALKISQKAMERLAAYCCHQRDYDSATWARLVNQVHQEIEQERKPPDPIYCPPGFQEDHGLPPEGSTVNWHKAATANRVEEMDAIGQVREEVQIVLDTPSHRIIRKKQVLKKCLAEYENSLRKAYS